MKQMEENRFACCYVIKSKGRMYQCLLLSHIKVVLCLVVAAPSELAVSKRKNASTIWYSGDIAAVIDIKRRKRV